MGRDGSWCTSPTQLLTLLVVRACVLTRYFALRSPRGSCEWPTAVRTRNAFCNYTVRQIITVAQYPPNGSDRVTCATIYRMTRSVVSLSSARNDAINLHAVKTTRIAKRSRVLCNLMYVNNTRMVFRENRLNTAVIESRYFSFRTDKKLYILICYNVYGTNANCSGWDRWDNKFPLYCFCTLRMWPFLYIYGRCTRRVYRSKNIDVSISRFLKS